MTKIQKILCILLCIAILLGGLALGVSAYSLEINEKSDAAYDRVYDRVTNYGK